MSAVDLLDMVRDTFRHTMPGWEATEPFTDEPNVIVLTAPDGTEFTLTVA